MYLVFLLLFGTENKGLTAVLDMTTGPRTLFNHQAEHQNYLAFGREDLVPRLLYVYIETC